MRPPRLLFVLLCALAACAGGSDAGSPSACEGSPPSEADVEHFGYPTACLPECENSGRGGYTTTEPTTDPDAPSECRADGDAVVTVPCGEPGEAICPGGPPTNMGPTDDQSPSEEAG